MFIIKFIIFWQIHVIIYVPYSVYYSEIIQKILRFLLEEINIEIDEIIPCNKDTCDSLNHSANDIMVPSNG